MSLFWSFLNNSYAQDPYTYWVHGFAGNNSAWFPVTRAVDERDLVQDFPARHTLTQRVSYTPPGGTIGVIDLPSAASSLKQEMFRVGAQTPGIGNNAFVIAHSQGGLVSRWALDRVIPASTGGAPYFTGLVTFGSPHLGAKISNSRLNGDLDIFLNDACNRVGTAILASEVTADLGGFLTFIGLSRTAYNTVQDAKTTICDFMFSSQGTSTPNTNKFAQQKILGAVTAVDGTRSVAEDPVLNDYAIGAAKLNELSAMTLAPNTIRVNFYGAENQNQLFFRTMHYFFNQSAANAPFQATDAKEQTSVSSIIETRNNLANRSLMLREQANAIQCGWWWALTVFNPFTIYGCQVQENRANLLKTRASDIENNLGWFDNCHAQWQSIIGAREETMTIQERCICEVGTFSVSNRPCTGRDIRAGCEAETIYTSNVTIHDNDGVVVKESAIGMPGALPLDDATMRMPDSQHMQMRNDDRTKDKLKLLFNGDIHQRFRLDTK